MAILALMVQLNRMHNQLIWFNWLNRQTEKSNPSGLRTQNSQTNLVGSIYIVSLAEMTKCLTLKWFNMMKGVDD